MLVLAEVELWNLGVYSVTLPTNLWMLQTAFFFWELPTAAEPKELFMLDFGPAAGHIWPSIRVLSAAEAVGGLQT